MATSLTGDFNEYIFHFSLWKTLGQPIWRSSLRRSCSHYCQTRHQGLLPAKPKRHHRHNRLSSLHFSHNRATMTADNALTTPPPRLIISFTLFLCPIVYTVTKRNQLRRREGARRTERDAERGERVLWWADYLSLVRHCPCSPLLSLSLTHTHTHTCSFPLLHCVSW